MKKLVLLITTIAAVALINACACSKKEVPPKPVASAEEQALEQWKEKHKDLVAKAGSVAPDAEQSLELAESAGNLDKQNNAADKMKDGLAPAPPQAPQLQKADAKAEKAKSAESSAAAPSGKGFGIAKQPNVKYVEQILNRVDAARFGEVRAAIYQMIEQTQQDKIVTLEERAEVHESIIMFKKAVLRQVQAEPNLDPDLRRRAAAYINDRIAAQQKMLNDVRAKLKARATAG